MVMIGETLTFTEPLTIRNTNWFVGGVDTGVPSTERYVIKSEDLGKQITIGITCAQN